MSPARAVAAALAAAALLAACAVPAPAAPPATERSSAARAAFVRAHPCPATGRTRGACPGWVVDHVEPLCAGGADAPANMQWQPRQAAAVKDQAERARCAQLRRAGAPAR